MDMLRERIKRESVACCSELIFVIVCVRLYIFGAGCASVRDRRREDAMQASNLLQSVSEGWLYKKSTWKNGEYQRPCRRSYHKGWHAVQQILCDSEDKRSEEVRRAGCAAGIEAESKSGRCFVGGYSGSRIWRRSREVIDHVIQFRSETLLGIAGSPIWRICHTVYT